MKTINMNLYILFVLLIFFSFCFSQDNDKQNSNSKKTITGFLIPNGKPLEIPKRINAGESCIIDLTQPYSISGDISGSAEINYRIIVFGQCGSPPGTYNEEWIAYGVFEGSYNGQNTSAKFSYTAQVKIGGDVEGVIIFGQGIKLKLKITGNFSEGKLSYKGEMY